MKGTNDQLERNQKAMSRHIGHRTPLASLTTEEQRIVAALRDPAKAEKLYALARMERTNL